jgi:hypothetical protein
MMPLLSYQLGYSSLQQQHTYIDACQFTMGRAAKAAGESVDTAQ